ncbi:MAG: YlxR family protein [Nocardioides sp.]
MPSERPHPVRTCIGCRQRAAKHQLLRVVVRDQGAGLEVVPDPEARAPGRGAHLHPTTACLELAQRRRAFSRALRVDGGVATGAVARFVEAVQQPGSNKAAPRSDRD